MSRTHEQRVKRIREIDAIEAEIDQQAEVSKTPLYFEMGDLALEEVPLRQGANIGATERLEQLARETNVAAELLRQRRFVSSRVPFVFRITKVPWSVYAAIARSPDEGGRAVGLNRLAELINGGLLDQPPTEYVAKTGKWNRPSHGRWTVDAILSHVGYPPANVETGSTAHMERFMRAATPEAKREALKTLAAEPAVLDAMLAEPESRRTIYEGLHRHEQEVSARTERLTQADPIGRRMDQQQASLDLQKWIDDLRRHAERLRDSILPRLGDAPASDPLATRRFLREALAELDEALASVRTYIDTGKTDTDRFLHDVLGKR